MWLKIETSSNFCWNINPKKVNTERDNFICRSHHRSQLSSLFIFFARLKSSVVIIIIRLISVDFIRSKCVYFVVFISNKRPNKYVCICIRWDTFKLNQIELNWQRELYQHPESNSSSRIKRCVWFCVCVLSFFDSIILYQQHGSTQYGTEHLDWLNCFYHSNSSNNNIKISNYNPPK